MHVMPCFDVLVVFVFQINLAETMIDVLVDKTEAFLEHLSISRITLGNIVSFIELLGLDETKTKLADTLKTIQVSFD